MTKSKIKVDTHTCTKKFDNASEAFIYGCSNRAKFSHSYHMCSLSYYFYSV